MGKGVFHSSLAVDDDLDAAFKALGGGTEDSPLDGLRALDTLGNVLVCLFAGIPEEHRPAQMAKWWEFVSEATKTISESPDVIQMGRVN